MATVSSTTTQPATQAQSAKMHMDGRRPRDSMKSTWRNDKEKKTWGIYHWIIHILDVFHQFPDQDVPVHAKTDKMPHMNELTLHRYILVRAIWPVVLQYAYSSFTGRNLGPFAAFLLYTIAMQANSIGEIYILRRLAHKYGFLDGEKPRDGVPDHAVGKVFYSLEMTTTIRPLFTVFLAYRSDQTIQFTWWLPLELGLYAVVLDFWFYIYHRSCHEVERLWQYHRTHHLTKHPSPLLSSYADGEQEFLEIGAIPILTYLTLKYAFGLPMGFHDWWLCHEYIIFSEAFGHSGLRVHGSAPSIISPLLRYLKMDLCVEDHDMHHRKGWRKSANYGKQTRVWDRLFGTCGERVEAIDANADWENGATFPVF